MFRSYFFAFLSFSKITAQSKKSHQYANQGVENNKAYKGCNGSCPERQLNLCFGQMDDEKPHIHAWLKDIVAEYIWFMLTGTLVTSVGYNYIVNSGCSQDVKEMQKRHKDYEIQEKAKLQKQLNADPPRIYSSNE